MENKRFGFVRGFEFTYQLLAPKEQGKQGARKKLEIRGSVPQHLNDEMMEYLKEQGFAALPSELWEKDDSNLCWMGMKKDGNVMLYAYVRSGQHFHVKENVSEMPSEAKAHADVLSSAVAN